MPHRVTIQNVWTIVLAIVFCPVPVCRGQIASQTAVQTAGPATTPKKVSWADDIKALVDSHEGDVAVAIEHLETGESFRFRADHPMPTASLIKFPLMVATFQAIANDRLSLDTMLTLTAEDKVPGSGILRDDFSAGTKLSLRDAIGLMMAYSDNTATNMVIDQVGLKVATEAMLRMGLENTKLHAKVYRRDTSVFPDRSKDFGLGSTSANEMIQLLTLLYRGQLVDQATSKQMLDIMKTCKSRDMIPRLLPKSASIAHKSGGVSSARCDAGIVETKQGAFAICVLTRRNVDKSWGETNAAELLVGRIAKIAWDHFFGETEVIDAGRGTLTEGATGALVEAVQRTLNARMEPAHEISIDGDFGPATRAALESFQKMQGVDPTGTVDAATWQALGKLRFQADPVPDPKVIASEKLPVAPPDLLTGPPLVTSKAWVIADASTGKLLAGKDESLSLPMASTTKIMTGYLVLLLAEQDPKILDEVVTFSRLADQTRGSTSGVREGESLSTAELLYGLMLPSGNDASVALAEQFGARALAMVGGESDATSPYLRFVGAMNLEAEKLGLDETEFQNTHGLSAENHVSSARDLVKMACEAMRLKQFREIVSTRQHGCTVVGHGGYRRNVLWKNTNRLLTMEGFHGVKTGTTTEAGACLVSHAQRGGRSLIAVVLGAPSSDARYVDTRNLFRWAWSTDAKLEAAEPIGSKRNEGLIDE